VKAQAKRFEKGVEYFDVDVSVDALSQLLDVSPETIRKKKVKGVIRPKSVGRYEFIDAIRGIVTDLKETAAGRGGEVVDEQSLLARSRREHQEMVNAEKRGDLVSAADVERAWAEDWQRVSSMVLSVSSRLAEQMPHLSRADVNTLDRMLREALEGASQINE
ncbi:MAG: hypothetical protein AAFO70_02030, partial [Pseudomonadota bacterium]